ncbi:arginase family protein [Pseudonocardia kunmingensis]|uniref:arginase family protein n=1 Tax=Pseudonocardia kunmingensis TaxID=630975 RepID=UPI0011544D23|nr:arginase family protein [Pseudonocardia kunmingensis]
MTVIAVPFHLDEHLPDLELPLTPDRTVAPALPGGTLWERAAVVAEEVAAAVAAEVSAGGVPVVLSGDCTTALGVVAGLQRAGRDPRVVWFDAHGDVQTPETSTSGYAGGFPVRQLVGGSDRTLPERLRLRSVAERDVVLVDARDLDPPEAAFLANSAIRRVPVGEVAAVLPGGPTYLHLDVDVVDPADFPGLLFPAPGGPGLSAVADAVRAVVAGTAVAAVGIACTYRPGSGADRALGELARELSALQ